jgi:hypothetical protein
MIGIRKTQALVLLFQTPNRGLLIVTVQARFSCTAFEKNKANRLGSKQPCFIRTSEAIGHCMPVGRLEGE